MSEQNDETADGCEMLTATSDPVVLYQALCRATDEIEQLKRERDETQRELEMWKFERDEAMEHAARYRLEANKLIMMGIELREQNAKLRDLVERAFAAGVGRMKTNDLRTFRVELDQIK